MRKIKILIWGASGHALVVADIVGLNGEFQIAGFLDDINKHCYGSVFCGAPILGGREALANLSRNGINHLIVGVGDCRTRLELAEFAVTKGFQLITAIHPKSILAAGISVGRGTVIAAGAVINPKACIDHNVIINTAASVGHECQIQSGSHIGPRVCLGGGVRVGKASWIGIGSTVKDHINVGNNVTVGAGSVVIKDLPDNVLAYGVPAQICSKNQL